MTDGRHDILVVGAGPAGGHLARLLARRGLDVLVADRIPTYAANAFSSAGTLLSCMERFGLPMELAGSVWRHLEADSNSEHGRWEGQAATGAVLDFGRLRRHLAEEAEAGGARIALGWKAAGLASDRSGSTVRFLQGKDPVEVRARVVVDATGPARSLMRLAAPAAPAYLMGTGLELLVEVPAECWERFRESLAFFLGSRWIARGYSWIFPMQPGLLKVGAGRYTAGGPEQPAPLRERIDFLLHEVVRQPGARIVDVHGGTLKYARRLGDPYAAGPVIGIGDAVSTLNVLGGEGIRHAMEGAEIALPFILKELEQPGRGFPGYAEAMRKRFKRTWDWSEDLAVRRYLQDSDARLDSMIRFLRPRDLEFVVDILFNYNFPRAARAAGPAYLWSKLRRAGAIFGIG